MRRKILIEIDISPTNEAVKSYERNIDSIIEDETDSVLEKLRYRIDGYVIKNEGHFETWAGTKVKVYIQDE